MNISNVKAKHQAVQSLARFEQLKLDMKSLDQTEQDLNPEPDVIEVSEARVPERWLQRLERFFDGREAPRLTGHTTFNEHGQTQSAEIESRDGLHRKERVRYQVHDDGSSTLAHEEERAPGLLSNHHLVHRDPQGNLLQLETYQELMGDRTNYQSFQLA